jgi:hypothetical protein
MDLCLATLKAISFYLLHNISTLNQCRKLSCGTAVCKHFASYQGSPNYRWDLIRYAKGLIPCGLLYSMIYSMIKTKYIDLQIGYNLKWKIHIKYEGYFKINLQLVGKKKNALA